MFYYSVSGLGYDDNWEKTKVLVASNGMVVWTITSVFQTRCEMDAYRFPFDHHYCSFGIMNALVSATFANFSTFPDYFSIANMYVSKEWEITHTQVDQVHFKSNPYFESAMLFYSFYLTRKPSYYIITVILPIALLSFVGLMVFLLPPDSGEKISLSVTSLLSFFITQVTILEHLPASWETIPVISKYNVCE